MKSKEYASIITIICGIVSMLFCILSFGFQIPVYLLYVFNVIGLLIAIWILSYNRHREIQKLVKDMEIH